MNAEYYPEPEYNEDEPQSIQFRDITTADGKPTELVAPKDMSGIEIVNPNDFPNLDDAEEGVSLETKYYEFLNPGTIVRAVFNGMGKMSKRNQTTGNLEELPAAYFQTKDGVYLNGSSNFVEQTSHIRPGTNIQITYQGTVKTKNGNNVKKFDVRLLNLK